MRKISKKEEVVVESSTQKQVALAYHGVIERISVASKGQEAGIKLLAVSKKQDNQKIKYLIELGHKDFAENYLSDLEKRESFFCDKGVSWTFIGRLQSNKIARIVKYCREIQSVSSLKHAGIISKYAKVYSKDRYPIFLQVNPMQEVSKDGLTMNEVEQLAHQINHEYDNLDIRGIMSIPPKEIATIQERRGLYKRLSDCAKNVGRGELSLGMSADLELAIECGSSCVRVGRHIFGER